MKFRYLREESYYKYLLSVLSNSNNYNNLESILYNKKKFFKIEDYRDFILRQEAQTALLKNIKSSFIKRINFYSYISRTFSLNFFIYTVALLSSFIICFNSFFYFNHIPNNSFFNSIMISNIFSFLTNILSYFFDATNYYTVLLQVAVFILFINYFVLFLFLMIYIPSSMILILYGAIKNIRIFISITTVIIGVSILAYIFYFYSLYNTFIN